MKRASRSARFGPLLALVLGTSCGPSGFDPASIQGFDQWQALIGTAWSEIQEAPFTTAFQGVRRVEFRVPDHEGAFVEAAYRELVTCDGLGGFSIHPLSAETPVFPDEETFLLIQESRQGFFFRYRDFQVRDADQLLANFQLVGGIHPTIVAGRSCMEAQLLRLSAGGHHYRVAFDVETGLPLRCVEYDDVANAVASVAFESIDFAPTLLGVDYFQPSNLEVPFDLLDPHAASLLGFEPRIPAFVPPGFKLIETAKVEDHLARRWLKLGYTDGVEMLFFLHRSVDATGAVSYPVVPRRNGNATEDEVLVFDAGPVVVLQGIVGGDEFIVVGEIAEADLLRMIDSALD